MATPSLQSLERGLAALRAINQQPGAGIDALSSELGLSRGTVYRLLETLRRDGYVRRGVRGRYVAAERAQALSDGYRTLAWLTDDVRAILKDLSTELRWPALIAAPEDAHMVVRASTDHETPFVKMPVAPGASYLSIHQAPCGLAYLANCEPDRQAATIRILMKVKDPERRLSPDGVGDLQKVLANIRRDGFVVQDHPTAEVTFAVPIIIDNRAVGGLSMRYFKSFLPIAAASARYMDALRSASNAIARCASVPECPRC